MAPEIRTRTYCLKNFRPNPTAEIYFILGRIGKKTRAEENNPAERIFFSNMSKNMRRITKTAF